MSNSGWQQSLCKSPAWQVLRGMSVMKSVMCGNAWGGHSCLLHRDSDSIALRQAAASGWTPQPPGHVYALLLQILKRSRVDIYQCCCSVSLCSTTSTALC